MSNISQILASGGTARALIARMNIKISCTNVDFIEPAKSTAYVGLGLSTNFINLEILPLLQPAAIIRLIPTQNIIFGSVIGLLRVSPVAVSLNLDGTFFINDFLGLPAPFPLGGDFVLGGDLGGVLGGDLAAGFGVAAAGALIKKDALEH